MVTLTESAAKAKYRLREREADEYGRIITVRLLHPSEQTRIVGFTDDLGGSQIMTRPDGTKLELPNRAPLLLVAAVCGINENGQDKLITFPRSRSELDSIFDELDAEGLEAAGKALARLVEQTRPALPPLDEAKNSQGTPISVEPVG